MSTDQKPREFWINDTMLDIKDGLNYVAKNSEMRNFQGVHVIEKSAYDELLAMKNKAAEIAIAIGFEHNMMVKERDQLKVELEACRAELLTAKVGAMHFKGERDVHIRESEQFVKDSTAKIAELAEKLATARAALRALVYHAGGYPTGGEWIQIEAKAREALKELEGK